MAISNNDRVKLKAVQKVLNTTIYEAKSHYKHKVENMFRANQGKDAWKGLKMLSGYKDKNVSPDPGNIT